MSSIIPLDVVILCIQYIIFNAFKKNCLERSKRQKAVRIVVTITRVTTHHAHFFLSVLSLYVNTILHTATIIIRIIIIMFYNCNNFLSKKSRDKTICE